MTTTQQYDRDRLTADRRVAARFGLTVDFDRDGYRVDDGWGGFGPMSLEAVEGTLREVADLPDPARWFSVRLDTAWQAILTYLDGCPDGWGKLGVTAHRAADASGISWGLAAHMIAEAAVAGYLDMDRGHERAPRRAWRITLAENGRRLAADLPG